MRPADSNEVARLADLERTDRLTVQVRVTESWFNLGDIFNQAWPISGSISVSEDTRSWTLSLDLQRETSRQDPTEQASVRGLVQEGRLVRVGVAVATDTLSDGPVQWIFQGRVDDMEWGGDQSRLQVRCRDLMGELNDVWVEEPRTYSGTTPEIMEAILEEWAEGIPLTYDPDEWEDVRIGVPVQVTSVARALEELLTYDPGAVDVRYRDGDWTLTLTRPVEPDEDTPILATLTPDDYYELPNWGRSSIGIRDRCIVQYSDPTGGQTTLTAQTLQPIHGERYRPVFLDLRDDPQIQTAGQAQDAANAALQALSRDPLAIQAVMPLDWRVELGDYVELTPNGIHNRETVRAVVVGIEHRLQRQGNRTTLTLRGSYIGGSSRWVTRIVSTRRRQEDERAVGSGDWFYTNRFGTGNFRQPGGPAQSLGIYTSTTPIPSRGLNAIFGPFTPEEVSAGFTRYAIISLVNNSDEIRQNVRVYLDLEDRPASGTGYAIAVDPLGPFPALQAGPHGGSTASNTVAPASYSFSSPTSLGSGLTVGDLGPREVRFVGVRLSVSPGAGLRTTDDQIVAATCVPED